MGGKTLRAALENGFALALLQLGQAFVPGCVLVVAQRGLNLAPVVAFVVVQGRLGALAAQAVDGSAAQGCFQPREEFRFATVADTALPRFRQRVLQKVASGFDVAQRLRGC